MLSRIQSGSNINSVYSLLDKFIAKRYVDPKKIRRESTAIKQWIKYTDYPIAKMYFHFKGWVLFEKIKVDQIKNNNKDYLLIQLAGLYKELFNNYKYHKEYKDNDYQSWNNYLRGLINYFEINHTKFKKYSKNDFSLINQAVSYIQLIDWGSFAKLPLHRDLHLDNILFDKKGKINIIDFEHFCIGPLEYEFCNSLFWNDEYSLNIDELSKNIRALDISFNQSLAVKLTVIYYIEQIKIACINKDVKKIILLNKTFRQFISDQRNVLNISNSDILDTQLVRDNLLIESFNLEAAYKEI